MSLADKKMSRLVTVDSVVYNVLNDLQLSPNNNFRRLKQFALRGLKHLSLYIMSTFEIQYLTVDTNNITNLPDDYIDYIRIGYIRNGKIYTFSHNNDIPITREEENGAVSQYSDIESAATLPDLYTWLAAPPKIWNIGFVRYDKEYNRMIFSGDMAGESILLEYVSTGVSLNGNTYFPVQAEEALIAWVHYLYAKNDKKANMNEKLLRKEEMQATINDLVDFENTFTYDQLLDTINAGLTQLPKR